MKIPKYWTTVTTFSKTIALILFIALPFIGFWFGLSYQQILDLNRNYSYGLPVKPSNSVTSSTTLDQTSGWYIYTNNTYGIQFKYPENLISSNSNFTQDYFSSGQSTGVITISIPQDYYPKTNFFRAYLEISISKGGTAADCQSFKYGTKNEPLTKIKNVGETTFYASNKLEQGAVGTNYQIFVYHYYKNGLCYEINSNLSTYNIYSWSPPYRTSPVNETEVWNLFDQILTTFTLTNQSQSNYIYPTPTCMLRPACLDATPRCLIAEPANGWCSNNP